MSVYHELQEIYFAVHADPDQEPSSRYATRKGQHEAIWDALLLLAARIDGDETRNPRAEREISPDEFSSD